MKNTAKRIITMLMMLTLMVSMLVVPVSANYNSAGTRYNIMLVIDGSGSLISGQNTDPDGMRYELINDLLGILEDDGHNVGAIVFSGPDPKTDKSTDKALEEGIMLNTGMLSLDERTSNGSLPKDYISAQIKKVGVDKTENGNTDIGTALLSAERELQKAQKDNGMESLVFLFTDGLTDIRQADERKQSTENLNTATAEMSANDIRLFGAFLNKNGRLSSTEMTNIVCASNGIREGSLEFMNSYAELTNAESCHEAVNKLFAFLGYSVPDPVPAYDDIDATFTIPGVGVEEMNIRIYSIKGEDLPKMTVKLTAPDGSVIEGTNLNALCRSGRTFKNYKLVKPMSGEWRLHIDVPAGNRVAYSFTPVASVYVDAELSTNPAPADIRSNMDVSFSGVLTQNGSAITNPALYDGYNCVLEFVDNKDNSVKEIDIQQNANQMFEDTIPVNLYGEFDVRVVFECEMISVASDYIHLDLNNHAPTTDGTAVVEARYGLLQKEFTEVDLTEFADDVEDGKNLKFLLYNATCPADTFEILNDTVLKMENAAIGNGQINLKVVDGVNAEADLLIIVESVNMTPKVLMTIAAILIVLALIAIVAIKMFVAPSPKGDLTVKIIDRKNREEVTVDLAVPGTNHPAKTDLWDLLALALENDNIRFGRYYASDIKDMIKNCQSELSKVKVSKTAYKNAGKRVGAIEVKYGKVKATLFNRDQSVDIGDLEFMLYFEPVIEEEEEDYSDEPETVKNSGRSSFNKKSGRNRYDDEE